MLASSILIKKRDGQSLDDAEIRFLIEGYCSGQVSDEQMSAFAMAVCLRGMDRREITTLTRAMLKSGDRLPPGRASDPPRVDKHSTGGLGDKVSLVLAPLLAVCDVQVPMISGRGLGITGGTLDKLESIEGFRTDLSIEQATKVLARVGAFIIGASDRIAPADRRLYALRDVTGTVESIPLITASILSKKLAANLDALTIDVKTGSGAFMPDPSSAHALAESLVRVGRQAGLPTTALLTDMDQPLGRAVGNAVEVNEAVECLQGAPGVVRELTIELAAVLLCQVRLAPDMETARQRLADRLDEGAAMERFEQLVDAQGGRWRGPLPVAPAHVIHADRVGFIDRYHSRALGEAVIAMGGGRRKKEDRIDPRVGLLIHHRIGDQVAVGQPLITLHCQPGTAGDYIEGVRDTITISETPIPSRPLILDHCCE